MMAHSWAPPPPPHSCFDLLHWATGRVEWVSAPSRSLLVGWRQLGDAWCLPARAASWLLFADNIAFPLPLMAMCGLGLCLVACPLVAPVALGLAPRRPFAQGPPHLLGRGGLWGACGPNLVGAELPPMAPAPLDVAALLLNCAGCCSLPIVHRRAMPWRRCGSLVVLEYGVQCRRPSSKSSLAITCPSRPRPRAFPRLLDLS